MYRIFIVEDDEGIAGALENYLSSWGFEVKCAADLRSVAKEFAEFAPQLVLLDISLPFYNGFYWCGEIRKTSQVPVIFISSASDNMNIITAMNAGGVSVLAFGGSGIAEKTDGGRGARGIRQRQRKGARLCKAVRAGGVRAFA